MPLARHDGDMAVVEGAFNEFLLTCLLRGMTSLSAVYWNETNVSTHMPLARHDACTLPIVNFIIQFLLTCLLRGMTNFL